MSKYRTTIYVKRSNGQPNDRAKVCLGFWGGGFTDYEHTDRNGCVVFNHDTFGTADVHIDGSKFGTIKNDETKTFISG